MTDGRDTIFINKRRAGNNQQDKYEILDHKIERLTRKAKRYGPKNNAAKQKDVINFMIQLISKILFGILFGIYVKKTFQLALENQTRFKILLA